MRIAPSHAKSKIKGYPLITQAITAGIKTGIFTLVGGIVYFIFTYKTTFKNVVGKELIGKIKKIFKRGEKVEIKEQ